MSGRHRIYFIKTLSMSFDFFLNSTSLLSNSLQGNEESVCVDTADIHIPILSPHEPLTGSLAGEGGDGSVIETSYSKVTDSFLTDIDSTSETGAVLGILESNEDDSLEEDSRRATCR